MIGTMEIQAGTVPKFGFLSDIILYGQDFTCALFVFNVMETLSYNTTLDAYEIAPLADYECLYRPSLQCHFRFNAICHGNQMTRYIRSKYDLTVYCNYT